MRKSAIPLQYQDLDVQTVVINDYNVPVITPSKVESNTPRLALSDVSFLPRIGYKGADCESWLNANRFETPDVVNASRVSNGGVVARLGLNDYLILESLHEPKGVVNQLHQSFSQYQKQQTHVKLTQVPRQDSHACFLLKGENSANAMAKLCGVDLRQHAFPPLQLAQTSVARVNSIILRLDQENLLSYLILVDTATAEYLWDCLIDAIIEYEGCIDWAPSTVTLFTP